MRDALAALCVHAAPFGVGLALRLVEQPNDDEMQVWADAGVECGCGGDSCWLECEHDGAA